MHMHMVAHAPVHVTCLHGMHMHMHMHMHNMCMCMCMCMLT